MSIEKIRNIGLDKLVTQVYDFESLTTDELMCKFAQKINIIIEHFKYLDKQCQNNNENMKLKLEYLLGQGLEEQVAKRLIELINNGTLGKLINETLLKDINDKVDNITHKSIITVDDFGAVGDGVTDDYESLQNAFNWSRENKTAIYLLDKKYYTTKTLDVGGAIIRSLNNVAGEANPYTLKKPDGSFVKDTPYWNYFYNIDTTYTWKNMIDDTCFGCCIICDKDLPILQVDTGYKFNIEGIGIIGNHRAKNQYGLKTTTPTVYKGNHQHIKNVNVIGCGNDGIHLSRGCEVSVFENVKCLYNNGHGLYIGRVESIDSATEYLSFKDCAFNTNRLHGIYFTYWRKSISFENVDIGGNGQYQINSIDPLLTYDRRIPSSVKEFIAGLYFEDGNSEQNGIALDLEITNCWGEMVAKAVHINATTGVGAVNNLNFVNNSFLRVNTLPVNDINGCVYYINVKYAKNWTIKNTNNHALDMFCFEKIPTNGGNIDIKDALPNDVITSDFNKNTINQTLDVKENIFSSKRIYGSQQYLFKDLSGTGENITDSSIMADFTKTVPNGQSNLVASYLLTAHWGADNADKFSGYLLFVTKMPTGNYMMLTSQTSDITGFSAPPTISTAGVLTIPSVNYYKYTLTRIDIGKTN